MVKLIWWYWIVFNFWLSEKLFIFPSILNEILGGYSNLGCRFFPFSTLNISYHSLCPAEFLLKDQLLNIWGLPCMLLVAFPLLLLIFFLYVWSLLVWLACVLACFSLGLSCLLNLIDSFLLHVWKAFYFSINFAWDPCWVQ